MAARQSRMTMVRTKVAKSGLTLSTPSLAKIAVIAANTADRAAQNCQVANADLIGSSLDLAELFHRSDPHRHVSKNECRDDDPGAHATQVGETRRGAERRGRAEGNDRECGKLHGPPCLV